MEITQQLVLSRVNAQHRLIFGLERPPHPSDVHELLVALPRVTGRIVFHGLPNSGIQIGHGDLSHGVRANFEAIRSELFGGDPRGQRFVQNCDSSNRRPRSMIGNPRGNGFYQSLLGDASFTAESRRELASRAQPPDNVCDPFVQPLVQLNDIPVNNRPVGIHDASQKHANTHSASAYRSTA